MFSRAFSLQADASYVVGFHSGLMDFEMLKGKNDKNEQVFELLEVH